MNETIPSFEYCKKWDLKAGSWYVGEAERFDLARKFGNSIDDMDESDLSSMFYVDGQLPPVNMVYRITDLDYIALLELKQ